MSGILIVVVLYEILSVVGVGWYLARKHKGEEGGFADANKSMSAPIVGVTLALTYLGSLHVFGVMELSWNIGFAAIWVSVAHVILICVICLGPGRWVRRLGVGTVPEMLDMMYGSRVRVATSCANAAVVFGMLTMEAQAIGIVFSSLTGCSIAQGAIIGGIIGMLYVLLAGMEQIGILNVINTVVMFAGLILTGLALGGYLPEGWQGVQDYYANAEQLEMLSFLGSPEIIIAFGIPTVIATVFSQGISQQGLQVTMAAKSEKTVFKALIIAGLLNGMFTVFTVGIGVAAMSIPELAEMGAKSGGPGLIVNYLPTWLVAWLLASFLGALLSTFATNVMAPSSMLVQDIYASLYRKDATPKQITRYTRVFIVILSIVAVIASFFLPPMVEGANWLFSWLIPIFWLTVYGLFWKRSKKAAQVTLFSTWAINLIWTFTPIPEMIGMGGVMNAYITLACSLIIGVVANAVIPGKPGLFKQAKMAKAEQARLKEVK